MGDRKSVGTRFEEDWYEVIAGVDRGDAVAFAKLARRITGFLATWRAFDLCAEWDDIIQEVAMAAVTAHRKRVIEKPGAAIGYLRATTRFKFVDRLRRKRPSSEWELRDEDGSGAPASANQERLDLQLDLSLALGRMQPRDRKVVMSVYADGMTYPQASKALSVPLGSLKRYLRTGLEELRDDLGPWVA